MVFVVARTYTRIHLNTFNIDDYVYLLSLAIFIAYTGLLIHVGKYGDGKHQWDVTIADVSKGLELQNILEILYCLVMFPIKYVVLRQIEIMFFDHRRNTVTYKAIWALIWTNLIFTLSVVLSFICTCIPRKKIWQPDIEGHCIDSKSLFLSAGAINMAFDYLILVIPLAVVSTLQLSTGKKIRAAAVFIVGIFSCASSTVRVYYTVRLFETEDRTWAFTPVGEWSSVEFTTLFLVACFPYLPRLYQLLRKRDKQTQTDSSRTRTTHPSQNASFGVQTITGWNELGENVRSNDGILLHELSDSERSSNLIIMSNT